MSVLIIDDNHMHEKWEQRIRTLLAEMGRDQVPVYTADDYSQARQCLNQRDIQVVLLDQIFDRDGLCLLGDDLEEVQRPTPALQYRQGFLIARRIARDDGPLRPAVLMFTSAGAEVEQAARLQSEDIIDTYQGKPRYEAHPEDPTLESLTQFLRWSYNPVQALFAEQTVTGIDESFVRFLDGHVCCWRRNAPAILHTLASIANRETNGRLETATWIRAEQAALLPDLAAAWGDEDLWERLVPRLFPGAKRWRFEGEPGRPRLRYYRAPAKAPGKLRVWMLLDPGVIPELSQSERTALTNYQNPLDKCDAHEVFRVELPARCPGSRLPFLLGAWYDVPEHGDWVPLSVLRHQALTEGNIRSRLAEVVQAIDQGGTDGAAWKRARPGMGLLADGVLINREGQRSGAASNWHCPFVPLRPLRLHPDPEQSEPCPSPMLEGLARGPWLRHLAGWFATGRLDASWEYAQRLAQNKIVDVSLPTWWGEAPEPPRVDARRQGVTLTFSPRSRCLGPKDAVPLAVRAQVVLLSCTIRLETQGEQSLSIFEQLRFEAPVELRNCRVVNATGEPAALLFRDCVFAAGLRINGLHAREVELRNCRFEGGASRLEILNARDLDSCELTDCQGQAMSIKSLSASRLNVSGTASQLEIGPAVRCQQARLDLQGGKVALDNVRIDEQFNAKLHAGASLTANRGRWGLAVVSLDPGTGPVRCLDIGMERLAIRGPQQQDSTSPNVRLERLEIDQGLELSGNLNVLLTQSEVEQSIDIENPIGRLELQDVHVTGSVDLKDAGVQGELKMSDCLIGQVFRAERARLGGLTVLSSNCVGGLLFAGSVFSGAVCIAQASENAPGGQNRTDLTGVIFRDQLDFSGATFGAAADFSHTVVGHEVKFQKATFQGPAWFDGLQAGGNLVFQGATFEGPVSFTGAIIQGVLDMQGVTFSQPPNFSNATLERIVRLSRCRWPISGGSIVVFRNAAVRGLLDLSNPLTRQGNAHSAFQVDLLEASVEEVELDHGSMERGLNTAAADASATPGQLSRLARLYESLLLKRLQFDAADQFYRWAKNHESRGCWKWFKNWVWGHGTLPWRALRNVIVLWLLALAWLVGAGCWLGKEWGEIFSQVPGMWMNILFVESPRAEGWPDWVTWVAAVPVFGGAVLMNLFFAALARKLLR